ncbi:hypothetical protein N665_0218s0065 [Sinapis alba]|nr:hypothetical protein N665_0218s0065 [Sinapis alba]
MSSNKKFTLLSKVKPFKNNWRVQVKMLHSWKQTPPYADETLEIVLVDETWRVIENFKVSKSGGKYKPCSHEYKITITDKTVFKGSDHHDESSFLSLADFSELSKGKLDDKLLIGEIQITNAFDATILDLNPTMAEAIDFKEKMKDDPLPLALTTKKQERREIISVADDWNDVGISLISELFGITEIIKTKIVCTVTAIDTDWAWYYIGCKRFSHIVSMLTGNGVRTDNPLFRCNKCRTNVSNVEPKFKLHLIVHDKSGTCNIMLLGYVAKTIIGSEAVELWDGSYEDILPPPILALVGKSFCFGVTTCSDGTDIFNVSEVLTLKRNTDKNSECSTPLSKRKGNESDLPEELTSTSKKICPTAIKLEKTKTD